MKTQNEAKKTRGTLNVIKGSVKETTGKILGNTKMQAKGAVQKADGKVESLIATGQQKIKESAELIGDVIEHTGDKLSQAGFSKAGQAMRKLGNKIEHSKDKPRK